MSYLQLELFLNRAMFILSYLQYELFSMEFCCQRLGATAAILLTKLESSKSDLLAKVVESTSEIYRYAEVLSKQKNLD